jgi:hypothetical protein
MMHEHRNFFKDEEGRVRVFRIAAITLGGLALAGVMAVILGWVVQWLWNHTLAEWFKWPLISYWQAVGLFILGKLLFGHPPVHGHPARHMHDHMRGHWEKCRGGSWKREWLEAPEHFHAFWEAEGKAAFEAYMTKVKDEKK